MSLLEDRRAECDGTMDIYTDSIARVTWSTMSR